MLRAKRLHLNPLVIVIFTLLYARTCDHRLPKGARDLDRSAVTESILAAKSARPDTDAGTVLGDLAFAGVRLRDVSDDAIRRAVSRWKGTLVLDRGVEVHLFEMTLKRSATNTKAWRGTVYRRGNRVNLHVQHEDGMLLPEFRVWRGSHEEGEFRFGLGEIELVFGPQ